LLIINPVPYRPLNAMPGSCCLFYRVPLLTAMPTTETIFLFSKRLILTVIERTFVKTSHSYTPKRHAD
jgi:hypothetical protein